jgi:hypothetical protein
MEKTQSTLHHEGPRQRPHCIENRGSAAASGALKDRKRQQLGFRVAFFDGLDPQNRPQVLCTHCEPPTDTPAGSV